MVMSHRSENRLGDALESRRMITNGYGLRIDRMARSSNMLKRLRGGQVSKNTTIENQFQSALAIDSSDYVEKTTSEPILTETKQRFVLLPIQYDKVWKMYKQHQVRLPAFIESYFGS